MENCMYKDMLHKLRSIRKFLHAIKYLIGHNQRLHWRDYAYTGASLAKKEKPENAI